jgi:hypothetical protein
LLVSAVSTEGQELAVRVQPEKPTSALGEPVFVVVEMTNISSRMVEFADDGECAQSFKPVTAVNHRTQDTLYGCSGGGVAGSCAGSFVQLKPREKLSHRYLLPDEVEPDEVGVFDYTLEGQIRFYADDGSHAVINQQDVSEAFTLDIVEAKQSEQEADYAPLVADLKSLDPKRRWIALRAITEHPQGFLEPVILKLSQEPQTMSISVSGLENLGTDRAKRRLAELTGSEYKESVRQPATTALAKLGDPACCDLMLQLMKEGQGYTSEVAARGAGLTCGDRAVPQLASFLRLGPNTFPPFEIAYALGNTKSRAAVPILIDLLGNSDVTVRRAASEALYTLTHRPTGEDSASEHQHWISWWALEGKTAQIFDPTECP